MDNSYIISFSFVGVGDWDKKRENPYGFSLCGAYGTRTRDPMRDRHVF